MTACGSEHETHTCERTQGNHEYHTAYDDLTEMFVDWVNEGFVKPAPGRGARDTATKRTLREMAQRTE